MKNTCLIAALVIVFLPVVSFSQTNWQLVTYNVSFKVKNAGISVNGRFSQLTTELFFSPDKLSTSRLKGTIDPSTIKTGIHKRDVDLKNERFFDVEKYKVIEVVSSKLYVKGSQYAGLFNITIKGITKEVEIPFEFDQFADEADFKTTFILNRNDFGLGGSSMTMSDDATVSVTIKAKK